MSAKKSLVLAIRLARDRVLARERQAEGMPKGLVNPLSAGVFLRGGQGLLSCVPDLDVVLAVLDQLDLFQLERQPQHSRPSAHHKGWPEDIAN
jgi:hypothetical protein